MSTHQRRSRPTKGVQETLGDHFSVRVGLPLKFRLKQREELVFAQVITPTDLKVHNNLIALPMFLDGNHTHALVREGFPRESLSVEQLTTALLTRFKERVAVSQRGTEEAGGREARKRQDSYELAWQAMKDAQSELRYVMKRQEMGEMLLEEDEKRARAALHEAKARWLSERKQVTKQVSQATAVGHQYRELKLMKLSSVDVQRHALRTGDLLLVAKGQRPLLYYFHHPLDFSERDPQLSDDSSLFDRLYHQEPVYVAHSSFMVLRPHGASTLSSASLAAWWMGRGYEELLRVNHRDAFAWRVSAKELSILPLNEELTEHQALLSDHWLSYYYESISQQMTQEVELKKFKQDQALIVQGGRAQSSLYNLLELKAQLLSWLASPEGEVDESSDDLVIDFDELSLNVVTPRLHAQDVSEFQIGLSWMKDDQLIEEIQQQIKDTRLGYVDFEKELIQLVLYVGSVRSMELSCKIPWGTQSSLWHRLKTLQRVVDQREMYDPSAAPISIEPAHQREPDPHLELKAQSRALKSALSHVCELMERQESLIYELDELSLKRRDDEEG